MNKYFKVILQGLVWAGLLVALYLPIGETVNTDAGKLVAERWSLVSLALGSAFFGDPLKLRWPYLLCTSVFVALVAGLYIRQQLLAKDSAALTRSENW